MPNLRKKHQPPCSPTVYRDIAHTAAVLAQSLSQRSLSPKPARRRFNRRHAAAQDPTRRAGWFTRRRTATAATWWTHPWRAAAAAGASDVAVAVVADAGAPDFASPAATLAVAWPVAVAIAGPPRKGKGRQGRFIRRTPRTLRQRQGQADRLQWCSNKRNYYFINSYLIIPLTACQRLGSGLLVPRGQLVGGRLVQG